MAEVATIQFRADVGDLRTANNELDKLAKNSTQAEKAADRVSEAVSGIGSGATTIAPNIAKGTKALGDLDKAANKSTVSAGQLKAGWANATQQFIDIGVTLQGGMSPITVLTQQGPQLAMAFGSFSNTITAFASVINPMTVGLTALAAGVGYLGFKAYDSYKQTELMNQSIAKMGFQAGTTAQQLKDMAQSLAKSTGASADNAQKAVQVAAGISQTTDQLRSYAAVALNVSRETGEKVDDLVNKFAKLSDDPIEALKTLGKQFGILNPQLYEQVKALSDAGDKVGAYDKVLLAVNDRINQFKNDQKNALGDVTSSWDVLIGRVKDYLSQAQERPVIKIEQPKTGLAWLDNANQQIAEAQKKASDQVAERMNGLKQLWGFTSQFVSSTNERAKKAGEAIIAIDNESLQYQLRSQKIAKDIEQTRKNISALESGGSKEQLARANALLAAQQKSYEQALKAEKKRDQPAKPKAIQADAGDKLTEQYQAQNLALDAQIKMLQQRTTGELNASQQRKDFFMLQAKYQVLEDASRSRALTKQEQQMLASKEQSLAEAKITADKGDQLLIMQKHAQLMDELVNRQKDADAYSKAMKDSATESSLAASRYIRDMQDASRVSAAGGDAADQAWAVYQNRLKDTADDLNRADWKSGAIRGFKDWSDAATNYSQIAGDAVASGMSLASNAISNFVLTGKGDFVDFTKSILKMISDIITQLLLMKAIKATASAFGFSLDANAKGGVYSEPSLHQFANGVYETPQFFNISGRKQFAKGGVFAEAGPEAIMPLTRDSQGRLGVRSDSSSAPSMSFSTIVNVESGGGVSATTSGGGDAMGRGLAAEMQNAATQVVQKHLKPGGLIYNFNKGR
ncbi:TPA: phage tail tape measure protein [Enterobacter cloacae]|nr:phage tail tape measure protein [Enterobacter cloacae]